MSRAANRRGFTLIELMIVVAIIGILASVAIPKFAQLLRKSQEGSTKGNMGTIRSALSIYYGDMEGMFPSDNLSSLTLNGKYLGQIPTANLGSYHAPSGVICTSAFGTCMLGLGAPSIYDGQLGPVWVYWEREQPPMMGVSRSKGDFWLGCQHTDTRGTVWTIY